MGLLDKVQSYLNSDGLADADEQIELGMNQEQMAFPNRSDKRPVSQKGPEHREIERPSERPSVYSKSKQESNTQLMRQRQMQAEQTTKTTIALKYPKKYEDATEIVDLLIENECVLIDFQYMLEAQARRCLDFIDGASRVLFGNLQKVGASMYLLTPLNVIVDVEEMGLQSNPQESSFDFDMKRR